MRVGNLTILTVAQVFSSRGYNLSKCRAWRAARLKFHVEQTWVRCLVRHAPLTGGRASSDASRADARQVPLATTP